MTIEEAIKITDEIKPNAYTNEQKVRWLSELDGLIYDEITSTHEGTGEAFAGYNDSTPATTVLTVGAPYDEIYINYLSMRIDRYNNDPRYNNSAAAFAATYNSYANHINRTVMPLQDKQRIFVD